MQNMLASKRQNEYEKEEKITMIVCRTVFGLQVLVT